MSDDYTAITVYLKPEAAAALKTHVVAKSGSLRALSPWARDAILDKMKAEGIDIKLEWRG
ncbi:MAG TPA: hypothetical protein PKJ51_01850 [Methanothrix sp.]|nr:hypothetical protein [Methanothrix sp.]